MTLIFGLLCFAGGLVVGWFLFPAPLFITNLWKRFVGQKELEQKH